MPVPADSPGPTARDGRESWLALTASQRGAAHEAMGLPNQDAVAVHQVSPGAVAVAVADGHGHHRHFRSARGSELAVTVAGPAAAGLAARLDELGTAGQIESQALGSLVPDLVGRWRDAVHDDLAARPFSAEESEHRFRGDDALIAYGSTLLLAIAAPRWLVLVQIGDGDIVAVQPDGRALLPVPGDPSLDGRQTTSLCGPEAERDFRAGVVDMSATALSGVLLATDGYGNAQVADPWAEAVSADLAQLISDRPRQWLAGQLPSWAGRCASADGSADDTTVALLLAPQTPASPEAAAETVDIPQVPAEPEGPAGTQTPPDGLIAAARRASGDAQASAAVAAPGGDRGGGRGHRGGGRVPGRQPGVVPGPETGAHDIVYVAARDRDGERHRPSRDGRHPSARDRDRGSRRSGTGARRRSLRGRGR